MSNSNLDKLNSYFQAQYSNCKITKNGTAIEFTTQDSDFRVYLPTGTVATGGDMTLKVKLNHIRAAGDDDAEINVVYDAHGNIKSPPTVTYNDGSDAQIPDWVSTGVSLVGGVSAGVGELAGLFLAPETAGVSLAVTTAVSGALVTITKGVTTGISIYNSVAHKICAIADDGGRLYFSNVVAHALNRLNSAALDFANGGSIPKAINFKNSLFQDAIGAGKYQSDKDGNAVQYKTDGDYYRTWFADESVIYGNTGILLSCKIDGVRDTNKDDHVSLLANFDIAGKLFSAQAVLQMKNEDTVSTGTITYNQNGQVVQITDTSTNVLSKFTTVHQAIDNALESAMKTASHYSGYSDARKAIPDIVQVNLGWMEESIELG